MHHGNGPVPGKDLVKPRAIHKIALLERAEFHRLLPAGAKIVIGYRLKTCCTQRFTGMRTDVARTACHQYRIRHEAYSAALRTARTSDRYSANASFRSSRARPKATVACRKPAFEPQSKRWPRKRRPKTSRPSAISSAIASVNWISPPEPCLSLLRLPSTVGARI